MAARISLARSTRYGGRAALSCQLRLYSTATPPPPPASPARRSSGLTRSILLGLFGGAAYMLGSLYPPSVLTMAFPHPAPARLAMDSPEGKAHAESTEQKLLTLPQVQKLLASQSPAGQLTIEEESSSSAPQGNLAGANPATLVPAQSPNPASTSHYLLSRPYARFPKHKAMHSLTAGALRGPGLFATAPVVLSLTPHGAQSLGGHEGDGIAFLHLGRSMCGHDGLIHGGLLATVLDETLARTAFYSLPSHIGVTARLEIDYRAPVKADQIIVVRTRRVDAKGRKATVEGSIEDLQGNTLVQAKAIFVEPKFAKFLDTSLVKDIMDMDTDKR